MDAESSHKSATHVETGMEVPRDAGSIPAASTFKPVTIRRNWLFLFVLHQFMYVTSVSENRLGCYVSRILGAILP